MEVVENNFFLLFLNGFLFGEDSGSLEVDGTRVQQGILEDISQNVNSSGNILLEHASKVSSVFAGGISVQRSANVFNSDFKIMLRSFGSSFLYKEVIWTI